MDESSLVSTAGDTLAAHTRAAKLIPMASTIVVKPASNDLTAHTRSEIICKDKWRRIGDGNKQRRRC